MELSKRSEPKPAADDAATSFFRIAVPAWNWGRSMVGLSPAGSGVSRDEMQRLFRQDLSFDSTRDRLNRRNDG
jgi:hypothetical protein